MKPAEPETKPETEPGTRPEAKPEVRGVEVDAETRCVHYRSALDIVAIKMACCGVYYACKDCHAALADHDIEVWPRSQWGVRAILCGACGHELSIREYMSSAYRCPRCAAQFNPACKNHYQFYFAPEDASEDSFGPEDVA